MSGYGATSAADKAINKAAAKIASKDPIMRATAEKVLGHVKALAEGSREDGVYIDSLEIVVSTGRNGVTDQRVIARDPAALAKEYGHFSGKQDSSARHFVPGHFYMTQAAAMVKGGA